MSGLPNNPDGFPETLQPGQGRKKGVPNKITQEGRGFAKTFTDDPRWEAMIWAWVEGVNSLEVETLVRMAVEGTITPEECAKKVRAAANPMPAGVFNCIMMYRFGKPPQTVKLKGAMGAKPYEGLTDQELAGRMADLAAELAIGTAGAQLNAERASEDAE